MDILLINANAQAKSRLYLNQGGKSFVEAGEAWGIAGISQHLAPTAAVVFDYDNDGRPDLYVTGLGCSLLLRNTGSRFEDVTRGSGLEDCRNAAGAVPIDFDGDGNLDLYLIRYWAEFDFFHLDTYRIFAEDNVNARNGGEKALFRNRGDGTFENVTRTMSVSDRHWAWDGVAADLLGDGTQRIYVANDFGPDKLWAVKEGRLTDDSRRLGVPDRRFGMGVSIGDLDGSGAPHVHVSNEWIDGYEQHGNFLWKFGENGIARDEASERETLNCGWAWGSAFADFDLDGREDLYVANGFITGSGPGEVLFPKMTENMTPGVLNQDIRMNPDLGDRSFEGRQVDCLFWNRGSRFVNVGSYIGLDRGWDGRAVALLDFDNNGSEDLLITTLDGTPHLMRNGITPGDRWISIRPVGTRSNRDAVGARVEVRQGTSRWFRWATGGRTGFLASSDPRLHFGIPNGGEVEVEVRWPSGRKESFGKARTGRFYTAREGEGQLRN